MSPFCESSTRSLPAAKTPQFSSSTPNRNVAGVIPARPRHSPKSFTARSPSLRTVARQRIQLRTPRPNRLLKPAQWRVFTCDKRFRVLVAGRRFGKTELALCELLRASFDSRGAVAWYVAPSYRQAKRIAWSRLKNLVRSDSALTISETDLSI